MQHKPQSISATQIISTSHSKCHGLVFTEEVLCTQLREPHPHTPEKKKHCSKHSDNET